MRVTSHCQGKEPFLEKILSYLRFKKIQKHIPSGSKVLDLGCGYGGDFLKSIENIIESGTGIDLKVGKSFSSKITLKKGTLEKPLSLPDNYYDTVVSLASLEHLENYQGMLGEAFRVLKPKGSLLLTAPSKYSRPVLEFLSFKLGLVSRQEISDHKNYFDKKSLLECIARSGFSSCDHAYFQFFMNNFIIAKK